MMIYTKNQLQLNTLIKPFVIFLFSLFAISTGATAHDDAQHAVEITYVKAAQAQSLIANDPNIIVLDVRTKGEYKRGHIEGAIRNNYFSTKFRKRLRALDRNKHYIVHCKSGHRSSRVVKRMLKDGFTQITHMDGGYDAWKKLPAVTP